MSRFEKLEEAIRLDKFPVFQGRHVGLPGQLARVAGVAHSTVRYAYCMGEVRKYETDGAALFIDAGDLASHFRQAKPGRKPLPKNTPCLPEEETGKARHET